MSELGSAGPAKAASGPSAGSGGDAGAMLQDVEAGHPIYTNSVDPLTEHGVRALKAWMATVPAAEVNDSYIAVLDQLAAEAATARAGADVDGSTSEAAASAGSGGFPAGSSAAPAGSSSSGAQGTTASSGTSALAGMGRAFTNYLSRVVGGSGGGAEGAAAGGAPGVGSAAGTGGPGSGVGSSSTGGGAAGGGSGSGFTGPRRSSIRMTNPLAGWAGFGEGSSGSASSSARHIIASASGSGSAAGAPRAGVGSGSGSAAGAPRAGVGSGGGGGGGGGGSSSAAAGSAGSTGAAAAGGPATAAATASADGPLGPLGQRARAGVSPSGAGGAAAGAGGAAIGIGGAGHVHGRPRRTLSRISTKISPPLSVTASASALLDRGYPDVRLSSHLLRFGPGDAEKSGASSGSSSGGPASAPGGGGGDGGSSGSSASGAAAASGSCGSSASGAGVGSAAGRAPLGRRGSSTSLPDSLPAGTGRSGGAGTGDARSASEPRSQRNLLSGLSLLGRDKEKDRDALAVPPPGSSVLVAASLAAAAASASAAPGSAGAASGDGGSSGSASSGAPASAAAPGSSAAADRSAERADRAYEPDPPLAPCPLNVPLVRQLAIANYSRSQAAHVSIRPLQSFVEAEAEAEGAGSGSGADAAASVDGSSALSAAAATTEGGAGRGADSPTGSAGAAVGSASAAAAASGLPPGAQSLPACFISVEPSSLSLKKGASGRVSVSVTLLRPGTAVNALLAVEVAGGLRLMLMVRALAEKRVFGIPLALLPLAPPGAPGAGGIALPLPPGPAFSSSALFVPASGSAAPGIGVPRPLAALRVALTRDGGLRTEGVFRMSAGGEEISAVRAALDAGTFDGATSPCSPLAAAQLIKVFLRELMPAKVLASLPTEPLLAVVTPEQCAALADAHLPAGTPLRCLLDWLVDCLAETAEQEVSNRMGAKALAVCVAPNLLDTDVSNAAVNPMTALMCSQKAVHLLAKLVELRLAARAAARQNSNSSGSGSGSSSGDSGAADGAVAAPRAHAAALAEVRASAKVPMSSAAAIASMGAALTGTAAAGGSSRPLPAPAPLSTDSAGSGSGSGAGESFSAAKSASGQRAAASAAAPAAGEGWDGRHRHDHSGDGAGDGAGAAIPPRFRVLPEDRWSCDIDASTVAAALHAEAAATQAAAGAEGGSRPLPAAPPRSDE